MAYVIVGAAWCASIAGCVWLATHDHPIVGVLVLLVGMSAGAKPGKGHAS